MFDQQTPDDIKKQGAEWEREASQSTERRDRFVTTSGLPIQRLYTLEDIAGLDYIADVGFLGKYPFVRGIHQTGYRGRLWTIYSSMQFSPYLLSRVLPFQLVWHCSTEFSRQYTNYQQNVVMAVCFGI